MELMELSAETLQYFETKYDELEQDASPLEPDIAQEEEAEKHLRAVHYWRGELERIDRHAQAEMDRVNAWKATEGGKIQRRIDWHSNGLFAFLATTGKKTWKGIYGTIKKISGREKVDVLQSEVFVDWAQKTGNSSLLRVKTEADKTAIKDWIKANHGELPPGVDITVGSDSYSVTT